MKIFRLKPLSPVTGMLAVILSLCIAFHTFGIGLHVSAADTERLTGVEGFIWGVNGHGDHSYSPTYKYWNMPETIRLAAEMGCKMYRVNMPYKTTEDYERLDAMVYEAAKYGIELMLVLENTDPMIVECVARRYNGKMGYGRIKYFQIHNETSGHFVTHWSQGRVPEGYDLDKARPYIKMFKDCAKALRKAQSDCKIVINSASLSDYYFKILIDYGVDFDIIGYDWYSRDESVADIEDILDFLVTLNKDIIICEINIMAMFNLEVETRKETIDKNDRDVEFLPGITKRIYDYARTHPRVKGLIVYELLDQPHDGYPDNEEKINPESHFGMIFTYRNGEIGEPKPIYYVMQKLMGGGKVTPITPNFTVEEEQTVTGSASNDSSVISSVASVVPSSETESTNPSEEISSSELISTEPEKTEDSGEKGKAEESPEKEPDFPFIPIAAGALALIALLAGIFLLLKFRFGLFNRKK